MMNEVKRYCVDCKTTRTPLWRTGPYGPRSLCNACGIKHRKRKTADARNNNSVFKPENPSSISRSDDHHQMNDRVNMNFYNQFGREMKLETPFSASSSSSLYSSSSSLQSYHVKKQRSRRDSSFNSNTGRKFSEVEEAAVLLMSLSCDSVFA